MIVPFPQVLGPSPKCLRSITYAMAPKHTKHSYSFLTSAVSSLHTRITGRILSTKSHTRYGVSNQICVWHLVNKSLRKRKFNRHNFPHFWKQMKPPNRMWENSTHDRISLLAHIHLHARHYADCPVCVCVHCCGSGEKLCQFLINIYELQTYKDSWCGDLINWLRFYLFCLWKLTK